MKKCGLLFFFLPFIVIHGGVDSKNEKKVNKELLSIINPHFPEKERPQREIEENKVIFKESVNENKKYKEGRGFLKSLLFIFFNPIHSFLIDYEEKRKLNHEKNDKYIQNQQKIVLYNISAVTNDFISSYLQKKGLNTNNPETINKLKKKISEYTSAPWYKHFVHNKTGFFEEEAMKINILKWILGKKESPEEICRKLEKIPEEIINEIKMKLWEISEEEEDFIEFFAPELSLASLFGIEKNIFFNKKGEMEIIREKNTFWSVVTGVLFLTFYIVTHILMIIGMFEESSKGECSKIYRFCGGYNVALRIISILAACLCKNCTQTHLVGYALTICCYTFYKNYPVIVELFSLLFPLICFFVFPVLRGEIFFYQIEHSIANKKIDEKITSGFNYIYYLFNLYIQILEGKIYKNLPFSRPTVKKETIKQIFNEEIKDFAELTEPNGKEEKKNEGTGGKNNIDDDKNNKEVSTLLEEIKKKAKDNKNLELETKNFLQEGLGELEKSIRGETNKSSERKCHKELLMKYKHLFKTIIIDVECIKAYLNMYESMKAHGGIPGSTQKHTSF